MSVVSDELRRLSTPMLCSLDKIPREWLGTRLTDPIYAAEVKYNGWRLIAGRIGESLVVVWGGRNGAVYHNRIPLIEDSLLRQLPPGTIVDGELIARVIGDREAVASAMKRERPHTIDDLRYVIFDVLFWNGEDVRSRTWTERRELVDELFDEHMDGQDDRLVRSAIAPCTEEALDKVLTVGFEGFVMKRRDSLYRSGKRSPSWLKIKPQQTFEAKVIGFKPGKGSITGLVGALECEVINGPVPGARFTCAGFDMDLREQITNNQEDWLDAIVEVKYFKWGKDGVPESPQYLCRRHDLERENVK